MDILWADPPPKRQGIRKPPPVGDNITDWREIVNELRENPTRWAKLDDAASASRYGAIRQRLRRWAGRRIETASRTNGDGTYAVYAHWVGTAKEQLDREKWGLS